MPQAPDWTGTDDQSWDSCIIGGYFLPGRVFVKVVKGGGLATQKGVGLAGAYVKDNGPPPAKITIDILLVNKADLAVWNDTYPNLAPPAPGVPRPSHDILHPQTSMAGVKSILIDKITFNPPTAKKGWPIQLECLETKKPRRQRPIKRIPSIAKGRTELKSAFSAPPTTPSDDSPGYR